MGAGWDQVRSRGPQFRSESGVDRIIRYLGGGALPAVLETVAVAVHLQDVNVVGEPVQQSAGEALRAEHVGPLVEGQVGGDQNGTPLVRWMGTRRLQDPDHAMHCLLTETFGELAPKPFRLMIPRGCRQGTLYGYGTATTAALREAAGAFADPLQLRAVPPAGVDTKPMPPEWQKGKRLGFEIRVRPVVRKARGSERAGAELDAYQVDAETHPKGEMSRSRDEVYLRWLSDRLERNGGAALELEQTKLVSFQRVGACFQSPTPASQLPQTVIGALCGD